MTPVKGVTVCVYVSTLPFNWTVIKETAKPSTWKSP